MRWAASDVSPSSHLAFHIPNTCRVLFVLCCVLGLGGLLLCCVFGFLFCKCFGIPNSPRSLDLDDRQGLIASSAMQQKKKLVLPRDPTVLPSWRLLHTANSLANLLTPTGPLILFSTSTSLINPDILLHLPPYATFSTHDAPMDDTSATPEHNPPDASTSQGTTPQFHVHSPEEVQQLISTTSAQHFTATFTSRDSLSTDPRSTHPSLPVITMPALLTPLSSLYPLLITVAPGEGVLVRPCADPNADLQPQHLWLNHVASPSPPSPQQFGTLEETLLIQKLLSPHVPRRYLLWLLCLSLFKPWPPSCSLSCPPPPCPCSRF